MPPKKKTKAEKKKELKPQLSEEEMKKQKQYEAAVKELMRLRQQNHQLCTDSFNLSYKMEIKQNALRNFEHLITKKKGFTEKYFIAQCAYQHLGQSIPVFSRIDFEQAQVQLAEFTRLMSMNRNSQQLGLPERVLPLHSHQYQPGFRGGVHL